MKMLILLFVFLIFSIDARFFEGQCRKRPASVIDPFNYELYLGVWYEVAHQEK